MRETLFWFSSSTFVDFLEELTGIGGLVPDPHFEGAGSHCTVQGGKLQLARRHLELWDHAAKGRRLA